MNSINSNAAIIESRLRLQAPRRRNAFRATLGEPAVHLPRRFERRVVELPRPVEPQRLRAARWASTPPAA